MLWTKMVSAGVGGGVGYLHTNHLSGSPCWDLPPVRAATCFCKSHLKTCGGAMLMDPDTPYAAALLPVQIIPPPPSCDWHVPVSLVLLIPCYPRRMISCQSVPQIFLKLNSTLPSEDIFLNSSLWFFSPSALKCHVDPWLPPVSATSGCLKQLRLCYVDSLD